MGKQRCLLILYMLGMAMPAWLTAQDREVVGQIRDEQSREVMAGVRLSDASGTLALQSGSDGRFQLYTHMDSLRLALDKEGYHSRQLVLSGIAQGLTDLGVIWLRPETSWDMEADLVLLSGEQSDEGEESDVAYPLLKARQDVFLNRASFDFSAGFFRLRGLDSREGTMLFNGIPMNGLYDSRPSWGSLGGLTDITRSREAVPGLGYSQMGPGGLLGITGLRAYPSALRKGVRLTASASNRSYRTRLMATFNSEPTDSRLAYLISVGWRQGASGYVRGTPYNSVGMYACLEWKPKPGHSFRLGGLLTDTRRGQSVAVTPEIAQLKGPRYNPSWGWSEGKLRNSRRRLDREPLLFLNHEYLDTHLRWETAIGYQGIDRMRTRLGYMDAANPDPSYYRNLPSFYHNSPAGVNYANANLARRAFEAAPQLDWPQVFRTNRNPVHQGRSNYLLSGDFHRGSRWNLRSTVAWKAGRQLEAGAGIRLAAEDGHFGQEILDLLGATYHVDTDPFSQTRNDLQGSPEKQRGATAGYSYRLNIRVLEGFLQLRGQSGPWEGWASLGAGTSRYQRTGLFRNARYPEESLGEGTPQGHPSFLARAGLGYRISGRHWLQVVFSHARRPPQPALAFADPRENNRPFPSEGAEGSIGGSLSYLLRHPAVRGRITLYYARLSGQRSLRSYFAETALGAAFFREAVHGIGSLHRGLEAGLDLVLSPAVTATLALAAGGFSYSGNPQVRMYYFPDPREPTQLPLSGEWNAGAASIDHLQLASGPALAGSVGIRYRDPSWWWADIRANYLGRQYEGLPFLQFVQDFRRNPESGDLLHTTDPIIREIRRQRPLPEYYLLNVSIGKSWLFGRNYIGVFCGVNNVFDTVHRTGGYQQGRLANYADFLQDQQSGHPSFGPRHWYGYGRTFYLNITWSL
ncbi:hypothetical protein [Robiginitalea sp. SC105]|uniref:hypothetical protein n=1 Tax=Robiginitalea sp. SC105 TaxID=2762332 RepID=UPI00163B28A5|nr:hypothetical protein [Robiginitalea sp. SC105]MBC2837999.1 hypothetical protein [Robiginitalea sp. SC105]